MWNVNLIDLALAAVVLLGAWSGWRRGFVHATLDLLSLLGSGCLALLLYRYPASLLEGQWPALGVWVAPLAFVGSFVLLHALLDGLAGLATGGASPRVHRHGFNRVLGVVPGVAGGLVNALVAALALLALPLSDGLTRLTRESEAVARLALPAQWLEAQLQPIFDPAIRHTLQALTVQPESPATVPLKFRVTDARARPELEAEMLALVNRERAEQGLPPLAPDPELTRVARAHSQDMLARSYFSHVTPEGGRLDARLRRADVRYLVAGENLALAQTLAIAHRGLMNSPGHRANILQPKYGRLGIGVLDAGRYGLMITQNFRN
jgi:uncharacterized protein YkwD